MEQTANETMVAPVIADSRMRRKLGKNKKLVVAMPPVLNQ